MYVLRNTSMVRIKRLDPHYALFDLHLIMPSRLENLVCPSCGTTQDFSPTSRRSRACSRSCHDLREATRVDGSSQIHIVYSNRGSRRFRLHGHSSNHWPILYPYMYLTHSNLYLNNGIRPFGTTNPLSPPRQYSPTTYT
jgi:hypothetical protein